MSNGQIAHYFYIYCENRGKIGFSHMKCAIFVLYVGTPRNRVENILGYWLVIGKPRVM